MSNFILQKDPEEYGNISDRLHNNVDNFLTNFNKDKKGIFGFKDELYRGQLDTSVINLPPDSMENIEDLCEYFNIEIDTVDMDGNEFVVNTMNGVYLSGRSLRKIPIRFGVVKGDFDCSWNELSDLTNAPERVLGKFDASNNNLTSIKGCPNYVEVMVNLEHNIITKAIFPKGFSMSESHAAISLSDNPLTTMKNLPRVLGFLNLSWTHITNLLGCPVEVNNLGIGYCKNLKSSERPFYGAPVIVNGSVRLPNCGFDPDRKLLIKAAFVNEMEKTARAKRIRVPFDLSDFTFIM